MEFKNINGKCSKLNKECNFVVAFDVYKEDEGRKFKYMENSNTNECCEPRTCENMRECETYLKNRK